MKILYDDAVMTINWDENNKILEYTWKKFASGEGYKKPLEKLVELMTYNNATKMLSDMRNMKSIAQSDKMWTEQTFMPNAIKAGVKYWALVLPTSTIAQMSVKSMEKEIKKETKPPFEEFFTDNIEEGKEWLKKQP